MDARHDKHSHRLRVSHSQDATNNRDYRRFRPKIRNSLDHTRDPTGEQQHVCSSWWCKEVHSVAGVSILAHAPDENEAAERHVSTRGGGSTGEDKREQDKTEGWTGGKGCIIRWAIFLHNEYSFKHWDMTVSVSNAVYQKEEAGLVHTGIYPTLDSLKCYWY